MARGRPARYDPAAAEMARAHLEAGGRIGELAKALGIDRKTLYRWASAKPELSSARRGVSSLPERPQVDLQPTARVYSLAAWGVPMKAIDADLPTPRQITPEDVDDMLWAQGRAA